MTDSIRDPLSYVETLRNRVSREVSSTGYTRWALLIALGYLVSRLIHLYSDVFTSEDAFASVLAIFAQISVLFIWASLLISGRISGQGTGKIALRIVRHHDLHITPISVILIAGLPAYSAISSMIFGVDTGFITFSLLVDFLLLTSYGLLIIGPVAYIVWHRLFRGLPSQLESNIYAIPIQEGRLYQWGLFVFYMTALIVIFLNSLSLYLTLRQVPKNSAGIEFLYSLLAFAALWISVRLLQSNVDKEKLSRLENIEQEAFLNDLPDSSVRKRLESELIGETFGTWFENALTRIKKVGEEILGEYENLLKEARALNAEVSGRNPKVVKREDVIAMESMTSHVNGIYKKFRSWQKMNENLGKWIDKARVKIVGKSSYPNIDNDLKEARLKLKEQMQVIAKKMTAVIDTVNEVRQATNKQLGLPK